MGGKKMKKFDIKKFSPCENGLVYYNSKSSFEEAWNDCEYGDWMLWIAYRLGVDERTFTRAKVLCANTVRHLMTDKRSTEAVDAALRYANGEIRKDELNVYVDAASDAYNAAYVVVAAAANRAYAAAAAAANAAAAATAAAATAAITTSAAIAASSAVANAAANTLASAVNYTAGYEELEDCAHVAKETNRRQTADICREVLTEAVFEKIKQFEN
jgi:hypothetical protein